MHVAGAVGRRIVVEVMVRLVIWLAAESFTPVRIFGGGVEQFPALRFVVVRPRRLLTDQTNTSGLPQKLPAAADVASEIVRSLCALPPAPGVHLIE